MLTTLMMIGIILCVIVEIPLVIIIPIVAKFCLQKNSWHIYYRTIFSTLLFSLSIYLFFTICLDIILLSLKTIPTENLTPIDKFYNICVIMQRTVATLRRKDYENYKSYLTSFLIFLIIILYGVIVKNIGKFWTEFDSLYYTFAMAFDSTTIIISLYLWYINVKLRKLTVLSKTNLSEKFQLIENIKLLKTTFPLIIPYIIINIFFNILIDYGEETTRQTKTNGNLSVLKINGKSIPTNYDDNYYQNIVQKAW
uniref:7TM_GPCR_Srx domain-containing protein n=1 Tax=Parastrongyloides trichosuri TaxID=131310 RepID=A0A0N4ZZG4_PARTI